MESVNYKTGQKLTPPEEAMSAIKIASENIESADHLVMKAASALKNGHKHLWSVLHDAMPEIKDYVCYYDHGKEQITILHKKNIDESKP